MIEWRTADVTDESSRRLLTDYFASRAAGFPASMGTYRTVFPVAQDFTPPVGEFVLGSVDGTDAACGGIRRLAAPDADAVRYEVKHLWVDPAFRGGGRGRALLDELERRARMLGATELVLDTNASLAAAGGLYRSSGYASIAPYNENPNATDWYRKAL